MDTELALTIRPFEPEDLEEAVAVWRASKRAAFPYVAAMQSHSPEDDTWYLRDIMSAECEVWLAEVDGHIAGLMALKEELIDQLFVRVDLQGRGVGTALLHKAMELSPTRLRLYTYQRNISARAFYEKHGFKAVRFGLSPPPESEPDVEYHWHP
jgi:ribosomal protein S18 acetylase RimI-like enzyme